MGIFDWTSDRDQERHEDAYGRGVEDARDADFIDNVFHEVGDIFSTVMPATSEHESWDRGWHDQKNGDVEEVE